MQQVFVIRSFTEADIPYVIQRQIELYREEYDLSTAHWEMDVVMAVDHFLEFFDADRDNIFILEHEGAPAGCIAITHTDNETAKLRFYFVEPVLRGQGAGQALLDEAMHFVRAVGYRHVFLWTFSALGAARHLYGKMGFVMTETAENNTWSTKPILEERWDQTL